MAKSGVRIEYIHPETPAQKAGLKEGDIIIAPVRVYQKKIAVITKTATEFLFSNDFIVLRREKPDLKESFSLFLSLKRDTRRSQHNIRPRRT
jgi:C-terminal processing protease CtpA/Prc